VLAARLPLNTRTPIGLRAGFFQSFNLTEANQCRELIALADNALGGSCAAVDGTVDDVLGEFSKSVFGFRVF